MQNTFRTNQNISFTALASRKIHVYLPDYHGGNFHKLLVFGPIYSANDSPFWKEFKKEALKHVADNSECSPEELMNTIRSIEGEARAAYANEVLNDNTADFQAMMAEDGGLFLLLSFSILGAVTELKFPKDHPVFGIGCAAQHRTRWLRSMFLVGNQVPFIVLRKLMELPFFQELKATRQWVQPLELAERTLHKFLMAGQEPNPVDLIHCLRSVILGPTSSSAGAISKMLDDIECIPSASQLSKQGVQFKKLEGELGSSSICYKHSMFNPVLCLPVLRVDRDTELMVESLSNYEIVQECGEIEPEARCYFKLLKELIWEPDDLKVLSSCGVIQGQQESLLRLLRNFNCTGTSAHLCRVRKQIIEDPLLQWRKFIKLIVNFLAVLCSCGVILFAYLQR